MIVLFLHGWQSVSGGVKAVKIAQEEFDTHQPQVVVGSSRGRPVALRSRDGMRTCWLEREDCS
jgi:hypothetical protein